ncbi:hypothetical protein [Actinoplanes sp. HUAS TT8]|uniref:hypothetical protein n=1 Tax=Actinoplanes sp. HUAS TT8 TaxID=3447453 RepID=UPI003F51C42D
MFARTVVVATAATALFGLAACGEAATTTTPAAAPAATTATTTAATPATSAATTKTTTPAATTPAATDHAKAKDGCPVTAATLQRLADYPAGWKVNASTVKCKDNWAVTAMTAPSPDKQGDGQIFFAYDVKTGQWSKKGEGSGVECGSGDAMNIPASTGFCG